MNASKNLPSVVANLASNLSTALAEVPSAGTGDEQYIKMDRAGLWLFGSYLNEVDEESTFLIDGRTFVQGFIAWKNLSFVDSKIAKTGMGETPIKFEDLPEVGAEWKVQIGCTLLGFEGPEEGAALVYKSNTSGCKRALLPLMAEIAQRAGAGEQEISPVVALGCRSDSNGVFYPELEVLEWVAMPDMAATSEPEPVAAAKPTRRRTRRSA